MNFASNFSRGARALLLLVGVMLLSLPVAASAHGDLESTEPAADSTIKKPVDHIILTFTEKPSDRARVSVVDGCGDSIGDDTFVAERSFHVLLVKKGEPGTWTVDYRVVSAEDGHKTSGTYTFTVQGKADCNQPDPSASSEPPAEDGDNDPQASDETPTSDEGSSFPMIVLVIGGLALIGIAILVRLMGAKR